MFRELLADSLLRSDGADCVGAAPFVNSYQPLSIRFRQNAALQLFLDLVDQQDMFHCFAILWEEKYKSATLYLAT